MQIIRQLRVAVRDVVALFFDGLEDLVQSRQRRVDGLALFEPLADGARCLAVLTAGEIDHGQDTLLVLLAGRHPQLVDAVRAA